MIVLLLIVWIHFVADFPLQTDTMATNKSTSNRWLLYHVTIYSLPWLAFGWKFAAITFAAHFAVDYCTSRGTSYLWKKEERHWFFCLIGFDQALHLTQLLLTYKFLHR